jgi:hypothetical protein
MTLVIQDPAQLLQVRKPDIAALGLDSSYTPTAGIFQYFVLADAVAKYGDISHGLPLPLPLAFAQRHRGPAQVAVKVLQFRKSDQPKVLLTLPPYTFADNPGRVELKDAALFGGRAYELNSPANDGLDDIELMWVNGNRFVHVSVLGADLAIADVQAVAELVNKTH